MRKVLVLGVLALSLLGASNCSSTVKVDHSLSAILADDATALLEGCGQQLNSGILYCRVKEGEVGDASIAMVGPASACEGDGPCVFYKIFSTDGEPALGGSIPRGQTRAKILWKDLLKRDNFFVGDRGFWTVNHEVHWIDPDGRARVSFSQGEILLRVYKKEYLSLHDIENDPNFAWEWSEDGVPVKLTSGLRAYVGRKP